MGGHLDPPWIFQTAADKRSSFGMEVALDELFIFHYKNQVLIKSCCYGNSRFNNMSAILAAILDFSKILFFAKLQQYLLELVENMCF